MVEMMCDTRLPVMLSTGMSPLAEVDEAVELVKGYDVPLAVIQSTTQYPSPADSIGLNMLGEFRDRYGSAVSVVEHLVGQADIDDGYLLLLQASSPLRTTGDLNALLVQFENNAEAE